VLSFEAMNSADSPSVTVYETVQLAAQDIPGAQLDEPFDKHTMAKLCHWLLCHGIKAHTALKKCLLVEG